MRTARIAHPVGAMLLLGFVPGCSENNELDPGTFTARLSGARTEELSGSAVAGVVFSEQGVSYTINMRDQGDEFVFLTVFCAGEEAPAPETIHSAPQRAIAQQAHASLPAKAGP
jgi:hypothetical protein